MYGCNYCRWLVTDKFPRNVNTGVMASVDEE